MSISTLVRRAALAPICCAIVLCGATAVASAHAASPPRGTAQQYYTTHSGVAPLHSLAPQHQAESYYASYGDVEQRPLMRPEPADGTGGVPAWTFGVLIVAGLVGVVPLVTGARLVRRRRRAAAPA